MKYSDRRKPRNITAAVKANELQAVACATSKRAEWAGKGRTPAGQVVAVGVTDTDDAMEEVRDNPDVVVIFPDRDAKEGRMGTLYIPNTLAIIKGCPNPTGARKMVDYLLSPEIETKLAEGPSHQIPLNPNVKATRCPRNMSNPPGQGRPPDES